ncbi:hypothetical protein KIMH_09760 [Bombiscardovia apis]|uniref:Uncharacterized protein n=1 Tax=Bombiscardovia apis TaxID=2932182 RepID=A0ABN6SJL9_9BIFI|nr:hypothetical protein KIMH_09760 [Bombiscardovia apis]
MGELYEIEAFNRLSFLGLPTFAGDDSKQLRRLIEEVMRGDFIQTFDYAYKVLNPDLDGMGKAVQLISQLVESD